MLLSMYAWDPLDVIDGETIGVCHKPTEKETGMASCWSYVKEDDETWSSPNSYLIDANAINETTTLGDFIPIQNEIEVPAMFGNWICSEPYASPLS